MEGSASEPVLRSEDYYLPCHGVGDTGPAKRVVLGFSGKDDGKFSSRINQIIRQAEKVPGPGKYVAHEEWKQTQTYKFAKSSREYKPMHKGPSAVEYERKDFSAEHSIGAKDNLSNHPRVTFGKVSPGKKKSFLDIAAKYGGQGPGPGAYNPAPGCSNCLSFGPRKVVAWDREKSKSKSLKVKVAEIGPDHYNLNFCRTEPALPTFTVPKEAGKNFIDKFVSEKFVRDKAEDAKAKREVPGPGSYDMQNFDLDKTSRGTYHLQLRGLSRSPASGYF